MEFKDIPKNKLARQMARSIVNGFISYERAGELVANHPENKEVSGLIAKEIYRLLDERTV